MLRAPVYTFPSELIPVIVKDSATSFADFITVAALSTALAALLPSLVAWATLRAAFAPVAAQPANGMAYATDIAAPT
ncbi:hypothetical protein [Paenibacillus medicaginis]|uniref:Uncharacterized protein n=1 Tax=Paenibacillus medicaginis TaxID=1470560 RepID=A0ABV5C9K8_9BACL